MEDAAIDVERMTGNLNFLIETRLAVYRHCTVHTRHTCTETFGKSWIFTNKVQLSWTLD